MGDEHTSPRRGTNDDEAAVSFGVGNGLRCDKRNGAESGACEADNLSRLNRYRPEIESLVSPHLALEEGTDELFLNFSDLVVDKPSIYRTEPVVRVHRQRWIDLEIVSKMSRHLI